MSNQTEPTMNVIDCVIEWIKGDKVATVTMPKGARLNNRIQKIAADRPEVDYILNQDGSICAHIPISWIKINPPRKLTQEQIEERNERLRLGRENIGKIVVEMNPPE